MIYLKNPAKKGKRKMAKKKRSVPKGYSSWKEYMAYVRGDKGGKKVAKRKTAKRKTSGKRKSAKRYAHNPPAIFSRNGGMPSTKKFVDMGIAGIFDATHIVIGKSVARMVPNLVGLPNVGMLGILVQFGGGVVAGLLGSFISPNAGKMMLASGLAAPMESLIKQMNIPFISASLGEELVEFSSYPQVGVSAYPEVEGMSAYPGSGELQGYEAEYNQQ